MIVYKSSDVKLSWEHYEDGEGHTHGAPRTCGYVKDNLSMTLLKYYIHIFVLYEYFCNYVLFIFFLL